MIVIVTVPRTVSAVVRPANTAARDIGSERKRSIIPRVKSRLRPMVVLVEAKMMV